MGLLLMLLLLLLLLLLPLLLLSALSRAGVCVWIMKDASELSAHSFACTNTDQDFPAHTQHLNKGKQQGLGGGRAYRWAKAR